MQAAEDIDTETIVKEQKCTRLMIHHTIEITAWQDNAVGGYVNRISRVVGSG